MSNRKIRLDWSSPYFIRESVIAYYLYHSEGFTVKPKMDMVDGKKIGVYKSRIVRWLEKNPPNIQNDPYIVMQSMNPDLYDENTVYYYLDLKRAYKNIVEEYGLVPKGIFDGVEDKLLINAIIGATFKPYDTNYIISPSGHLDVVKIPNKWNYLNFIQNRTMEKIKKIIPDGFYYYVDCAFITKENWLSYYDYYQELIERGVLSLKGIFTVEIATSSLVFTEVNTNRKMVFYLPRGLFSKLISKIEGDRTRAKIIGKSSRDSITSHNV